MHACMWLTRWGAESSFDLHPIDKMEVGSLVRLSTEYASCGDAAAGPLGPSDVGTLVKDDKVGEGLRWRWRWR